MDCIGQKDRLGYEEYVQLSKKKVRRKKDIINKKSQNLYIYNRTAFIEN